MFETINLLSFFRKYFCVFFMKKITFFIFALFLALKNEWIVFKKENTFFLFSRRSYVSG